MKAGLPLWIQRRFDPTQRYGLRASLFALASLLVLVPFSYLLLQVISQGTILEVDTGVASTMREAFRGSGPRLFAAKFVSFVGSPFWFYLIIPAAALFFLRRGRSRISLFLIITNLLGGALNMAVKLSVARPRPVLDDRLAEAFGKSFPSGHAFGTTVGYGTLLLAFMPLIARRWRPACIAGYVSLVGLVSASRLALGVHYLSDVAAGVVLGLAWLFLGTAAFSVWRVERGKEDVEIIEGIEPEIEPQSRQQESNDV